MYIQGKDKIQSIKKAVQFITTCQEIVTHTVIFQEELVRLQLSMESLLTHLDLTLTVKIKMQHIF